MVKMKADKTCKTCGAPIFYGINGAQMLNECLDCHKPSYNTTPTPVRLTGGWDELDALEEKCIVAEPA